MKNILKVLIKILYHPTLNKKIFLIINDKKIPNNIFTFIFYL